MLNGQLDATFIYPTGGDRVIQMAMDILNKREMCIRDRQYTDAYQRPLQSSALDKILFLIRQYNRREFLNANMALLVTDFCAKLREAAGAA